MITQLHPILIPGNPLRLPFEDHVQEWRLMNGNRIILLEDSRHVFKCEVLSYEKELNFVNLQSQKCEDVDEYRNRLKKQHPILVSGEPTLIRFVDRVSKLDDQKELTPNTATVTVVNAISKIGCTPNPSSWCGHASILMEFIWDKTKRSSPDQYIGPLIQKKIEAIQKRLQQLNKELEDLKRTTNLEAIKKCEDDIETAERFLNATLLISTGDQIMIKGHLTGNGVKLEIIPIFDLQKFSGKTETWVMTKKKVSSLVDNISRQIDPKGSSVNFTAAGSNSPLTLVKRVGGFMASIIGFATSVFVGLPLMAVSFGLAGSIVETVRNFSFRTFEMTFGLHHNCATWTRSLLGRISIKLPKISYSIEALLRRLIAVTPNDLIPNIPKRLTDQKSK